VAVYATVSGDGVEFVRSLGVDHVIDYHARRFEDVVSDADLVFDLVGGNTQQRSWQVLRRAGIDAERASTGARCTARRARAAIYRTPFPAAFDRAR
jgi:NADPH:quinone reductase-like Zn-dependent oxidoreductase